MQYAQLGESGLFVSRLALGAMTFGDYNFGGFKSEVDQGLAQRMVDRALDAGINLFDTADMYADGQSEEILGRTLRGRREDAVIVTKCFYRSHPAVMHGGLNRRHVLAACEGSLRRLGTDWIDLYLLHSIDTLTPLEETARALEDLVRSGKVRYVGVSNFDGWQTERLLAIQRALGATRLVANQVYYSLLGRDVEHAVVPQSRSAGVGLMIWGPLAGGFLTGKYTREDPTGGGGRRKEFDFPPLDVEHGYDVVERLKAIAGAHDAAPAQVALAWTLAKPFASTVLVGATREGQLESNLEAVALRLTDEEVAALDEVSAVPPRYPAWIQWGDAVQVKALSEGWEPA